MKPALLIDVDVGTPHSYFRHAHAHARVRVSSLPLALASLTSPLNCLSDLYISCIQCMDWMFANDLIIPGTVVYYDDVSIVKVRSTTATTKTRDDVVLVVV